MLPILAIVLHNSLNMSCVEDIIFILELHCLSENLVKNSLYKWKKYFGFGADDKVIKQFFCSACYRLLSTADDNCITCLRAKKSYFGELPFVNQLHEMFARREFYDLLQERFQRPYVPGIISDVYDGTLYQLWINNGFLAEPNNISFSFYTDGIPVFKSSKISMWPVYLTNNELPFNQMTVLGTTKRSK